MSGPGDHYEPIYVPSTAMPFPFFSDFRVPAKQGCAQSILTKLDLLIVRTMLYLTVKLYYPMFILHGMMLAQSRQKIMARHASDFLGEGSPARRHSSSNRFIRIPSITSYTTSTFSISSTKPTVSLPCRLLCKYSVGRPRRRQRRSPLLETYAPPLPTGSITHSMHTCGETAT